MDLTETQRAAIAWITGEYQTAICRHCNDHEPYWSEGAYWHRLDRGHTVPCGARQMLNVRDQVLGIQRRTLW